MGHCHWPWVIFFIYLFIFGGGDFAPNQFHGGPTKHIVTAAVNITEHPNLTPATGASLHARETGQPRNVGLDPTEIPSPGQGVTPSPRPHSAKA